MKTDKERAREKAWQELRINDWRLKIRGKTLQRQAAIDLNAMFDAGDAHAAATQPVDRQAVIEAAEHFCETFDYSLGVPCIQIQMADFVLYYLAARPQAVDRDATINSAMLQLLSEDDRNAGGEYVKELREIVCQVYDAAQLANRDDNA